MVLLKIRWKHTLAIKFAETFLSTIFISIMFKQLFIICSFLSSCSFLLSSATPQTKCDNVIVLHSKTTPKRPNVPSRQQILCAYENGSFKFQFAIPEGECQLTVTDMTTGFARQYVFDSSADATINVGTLTQAHIEISTANGHEYEGWLAMEL